MLKIVSVPDKILSTPTRKVELIDKKIKNLIVEMEKTLVAQTDPPGVGLAANQVGIDLSIFLMKKGPKAETRVFINPKILKTVTSKKVVENVKTGSLKSAKKRRKLTRLEGCLSIPRIWGPVKRANKVYLEYQDLTTSTYEVKRGWFQGFEATIIQHEVDHLNGVVFTQRSMEQKKTIYKENDGELKAVEI